VEFMLSFRGENTGFEGTYPTRPALNMRVELIAAVSRGGSVRRPGRLAFFEGS